jgi:hypothetical protein
MKHIIQHYKFSLLSAFLYVFLYWNYRYSFKVFLQWIREDCQIFNTALNLGIVLGFFLLFTILGIFIVTYLYRLLKQRYRKIDVGNKIGLFAMGAWNLLIHLLFTADIFSYFGYIMLICASVGYLLTVGLYVWISIRHCRKKENLTSENSGKLAKPQRGIIILTVGMLFVFIAFNLSVEHNPERNVYLLEYSQVEALNEPSDSLRFFAAEGEEYTWEEIEAWCKLNSGAISRMTSTATTHRWVWWYPFSGNDPRGYIIPAATMEKHSGLVCLLLNSKLTVNPKENQEWFDLYPELAASDNSWILFRLYNLYLNHGNKFREIEEKYHSGNREIREKYESKTNKN